MVFTIPTSGACQFSQPTPEWCPLLKENLGDTEGDPRPHHFGTAERFNEWVTSIWVWKVNPLKGFSPLVFSKGCLLIDPFGPLCGALKASAYFQKIFAVFPDLSGQHVSFAKNDNTIFINWGFLTTKGDKEIFVPSIDIFGFKGGVVNYRLAEFDRAALVWALVTAYGSRYSQRFIATLQERIWRWHVDEEFALAEEASLTTTGQPLPL